MGLTRTAVVAAPAALLPLLVGCFQGFMRNPIPQPDGDVEIEEGGEDVAIDDGRADDGGDGEADGRPDADAPDIPVEQDACTSPCEPGSVECSGDSLETCRADGCGADAVPCAAGCVASPEPHCGNVLPSNIGDPLLLCAGTSDLFLPAGTIDRVVFDTDGGAITAVSGGTPVSIRETGPGNINGIVFSVEAQVDPDAPQLAVFGFSRLTVPAGVLVVGSGRRSLVILSCGPAVIDGTVSVASNSGWSMYERYTAGPGGWDGGILSETVGNGAGGGGGGEDGSHAGPPDDCGGGGGGFGGAGGRGANLIMQTTVILYGGAGGAAYGTPGLVPLLGGSGGGVGAYYPGSAGGLGGGGGGAIQISSGESITIGAGGAVDAGGGGGGGGGPTAPDCCSAGGGGGSGGAILLEAPAVVIRGVVAAAGGGGGAGETDSAGAGAPGEEGFLVTDRAAGGAAVLTATDGGAGSDPSTGAGSDGEDEITYDLSYDGGGGGGGAGRIRINHLAALDAEGAQLHPAQSSGLVSEGGLAVN